MWTENKAYSISTFCLLWTICNHSMQHGRGQASTIHANAFPVHKLVIKDTTRRFSTNFASPVVLNNLLRTTLKVPTVSQLSTTQCVQAQTQKLVRYSNLSLAPRLTVLTSHSGPLVYWQLQIDHREGLMYEPIGTHTKEGGAKASAFHHSLLANFRSSLVFSSKVRICSICYHKIVN